MDSLLFELNFDRQGAVSTVFDKLFPGKNDLFGVGISRAGGHFPSQQVAQELQLGAIFDGQVGGD